MSPPSPSPREIVTCVLDAWQAGMSDDAAARRLVELGLSENDAANALELVRSGIGRAAFLSAGLPAHQISSDVDDDPIFQAAVKAGQLNIAKLPPESTPDTASLLAKLDSEDASVRQTAAYELGRSKEPAATAPLVAALNDPDTYVRVYAIQSLAEKKAKEAVSPCSALLRSDAPRVVLVNAIKALAGIGDPAAVPALIDATRHENAFVRHDAAWALGEFADPAAIPALEALLDDATVPVEKNELGITRQTSIYSVADQARRSLDKIRRGGWGSGARSPHFDFVLSLAWTIAGIAALSITGYAYFRHNNLSILGVACGSVAFLIGVLGLKRYFKL